MESSCTIVTKGINSKQSKGKKIMSKYITSSNVEMDSPVTIESRIENTILCILRWEKLIKFCDIEYILNQSVFCNELNRVDLFTLFNDLKEEVNAK